MSSLYIACTYMYVHCICSFTCTLLHACTIRAQKVWTVSAVPHPFWAESHPPKPQHATYCGKLAEQWMQPFETSFLLAFQAFKKLVDGLLCIFSIWPGIKKISIFWTGIACIHIVPRGRGQRDVPLSCICVSLSTNKTCWDNCLYHVYTLYIHGTYMVHTLTYYVHVHWLFNACTTEAISTANSPVTPSDKFMLAMYSAWWQESANRYIHGLSVYVVPKNG